ncbi:MAG: enoyl-CoA hydratase/isomerase family protein [Alphaproteobacteria bacterium]|nr:enoyl-CoA hydratase/isomerase family protein [Alphaproteobacteria bacterium]
MSEMVVSEVRDDVLHVTVQRPEKHNALSGAVLARLREVFSEAAEDDTLKTAVLRGAGEKSFAAGGDLRELDAVRSEAETRAMTAGSRAALDAIRRFPVPVLAALNGDARGGGAELAVACDFRLFAEHAHIGFIQGRLNVSTAWGGGGDLMTLVGPTVALRLLCSAEMIGAEQALALGLADAIAEANDLDAAVARFLAPLRAQAPQVLRSFKALAMAARDGKPRAEIDAIEDDRLVANWQHADHWAAAAGALKKG